MPYYKIYLIKDDGTSSRYVILDAKNRVAAVRAARRVAAVNTARRLAHDEIVSYRVSTQPRSAARRNNYGEHFKPRTYVVEGGRIILKRAKLESCK